MTSRTAPADRQTPRATPSRNEPEARRSAPRRLLDEAPEAPGSHADTEASRQQDDGELQLPHERDQSVGGDSTGAMEHGAAGEHQRKVMKRAGKDLQDGQVDTDMRATPGLDSAKRGGIVNDPKGRPGR